MDMNLCSVTTSKIITKPGQKRFAKISAREIGKGGNVEYREFLEAKILKAPKSGFQISRDTIHPKLFEFQKDTVSWAAEGDYDPKRDCVGRSWKPSIFMPKEAARIWEKDHGI